jgi:SEC-C motif-containing protein
MNEQCACGSGRSYAECCEPFITGASQPATAEQLMRSRYTAYTKCESTYLRETLAPERRHEFDKAGVEAWSKQSEWLGLEILKIKGGTETDRKGVVEFNARYATGGKKLEHHEVAEFRRDSEKGRWFFVDGDSHVHQEGEGHHHHHGIRETVVRQGPKIGRNDPCTCGSGKKYKKCCGTNAEA